MAWIQVDERSDIFPPAVFIDRISVVGGIQKELFNSEFRKICFHCEKGMEKGKHVMPGSPFQKRKYREVTIGSGSHIHVEVVTEEITFPVGVPSPVAVRLGVMALTVTGRTALSLTIADTLFPLLGGSPDRRTITGKSQMLRVDQSTADRKIQELQARFLKLVERYSNAEEMTTLMLNEFVEKIVVYERDRKGSADTTQKIEIYFNFIGEYIPPTMAEKEPTPEELEEIRKKEARKDRLHQNYLKRKANGKQKEYEERTKAKKKAQIESQKEQIRAEDREKGIYFHAGVPNIPKAGRQAVM